MFRIETLISFAARFWPQYDGFVRNHLIGPVALVIGSMLSITLGASLAKSLFEVAGPSGISVARIGVGATILCAFWRPWRFQLSRAQLKVIFFYGVCLGFMNLLFYSAIARLPIGLAIAIEFLGPLGVAIAYSKKAIDFFWAFLAAVGIILILPFHQLSSGVDWTGVIYALGAAALWALYILTGKRASGLAPGGAVTSIGMTVAFIVILPIGATRALEILGQSDLLVPALGVGFLSSALPYSLEMIALKKLPEKYFGLLMSLEPAIGGLVALAFLGEILNVVQWTAIVCVVVASLGSSYTNREMKIEAEVQ